MSAAHTPGPWRVDPFYVADVQNGDGALEIASTHPRVLTGGEAPDLEECHANARLIAAAPELLEALLEAHRALRKYEWYDNPKSGWASDDNATVRSMVDAALAKALPVTSREMDR